MKKYFYCIFLYLTIASCSQPGSEILLIEKGNEIMAEEYENEIIINNPLSIELIDNNLFIFQAHGDNAAIILDPDDGSTIGTWGMRGNGPGEFMYPIQWGINKFNKTLHLYDLNRYKLRQYKYNNKELLLIKELAYENKLSSVRYATILDNNNIVASVTYGNEKPLLLLNSDLDSLYNFGDIPDENHQSKDLKSYSGILSSFQNTFVNVMSDLGYIVCYDQNSNGVIKKRWEHYLEKPIYKGNNLDRKSLKKGFVDVKMTAKYIFCVYSGKKWDNPNMDIQAENILVFNHNGILLKNFHLDRCIGKITISDDEKTIYAVTIEPEINIVKYKVEGMI